MPSKSNARSGEPQESAGTPSDRATIAYHHLRDLIVRGRLAPGTRIIESEVASRLGVSRTPARAALQRLQQEGYIMATGSGRQMRPFIAPLTREDAAELFGIVGEVEGLAARRAAGLEADVRRTHVDALRVLNRSILEAARQDRPDQNRLFDLDTRFHRTYVDAGSGPRLSALHHAVKPQAERYIRLYISALVDEIETSVEEHRAIVDGIASGDGDAAQLAVQRNWRNAAARLSLVIDTAGERGSW